MADQSHEMTISQQEPPSYPVDSKTPTGHNAHQYQQAIPSQEQQKISGTHQHMNIQHGGHQNMVCPLNQLGDSPQLVDCPNCRQTALTRVESHSSSTTIIAGLLVGLFCLILAWIPCAAHFAYDTEWFCTKCGVKLAYRLHDQPPVVCHLQGPPAVPSQYSGAPQQTSAQLPPGYQQQPKQEEIHQQPLQSPSQQEQGQQLGSVKV